MSLVKEKIAQAAHILKELDIDLWLTVCRESESVPDPAAALITDQHVCWLTGFFITAQGQHMVLAGGADAPNYERSGLYTRVVTYQEDVGAAMREILEELAPRRIALNYSKASYTADGLSHGLYLLLTEYVEGTPYQERLVSAEEIIAKLRGRKIPMEIQRLETAARMAHQVWETSLAQIRVGMSEIEIAALLETNIRKQGVTPSFPTIVNAGTKSQAGHSKPSAAILEKGDLLHVDFGVRYKSYCSDIQRLAYFKRDGETAAPDALLRAFDCIKTIVDETSREYRPGVPGRSIDALAREILVKDGYPEYQHGLGHQIGQSVHDGGALVGPPWERYGDLVNIPLEENSTFTVELGVTLDGIGHVSLEEDLVVTPAGGKFLGPRQTALVVKDCS